MAIKIWQILTSILILIILGGVSYKWVYDKEHSTLYKDDEIIARHRWAIQAERTYLVKNSWYRTNVMCPKIVGMGGHETATRCYYPDDYYEDLNRNLIKTKVTTDNLIVKRDTPFYKYGTRGAYAGILKEKIEFIDVEKIEEFPKDYAISFDPKDTRNYKLIWRVWKLDINIPDGNYTDCSYTFRNIKIDLKNECNKLERAEVKDGRIWFYFNAQKGEQSLSVDLIDPDPTFWCYQEFANQSTACGGLGTGSYDPELDDMDWEKIIDGDWDTFGENLDSDWDHVIINYTIPPNLKSIYPVWQVKDHLGKVNITITNSECLNYGNGDFIILRVRSYVTPLQTQWTCQATSSGWSVLRTASSGDYIYEEAIWWEMIPLNITILSPINNTLYTNSVDLDWSTSKEYDWCGYSLDGTSNKTSIFGNRKTTATVTTNIYSDTEFKAWIDTGKGEGAIGWMNIEWIGDAIFYYNSSDGINLTYLVEEELSSVDGWWRYVNLSIWNYSSNSWDLLSNYIGESSCPADGTRTHNVSINYTNTPNDYEKYGISKLWMYLEIDDCNTGSNAQKTISLKQSNIPTNKISISNPIIETSSGSHNITMYCNNTAGEEAHDIIYFNTTDVSIDIYKPQNNSMHLITSVDLNWSVVDAYNIDTCVYRLDGSNDIDLTNLEHADFSWPADDYWMGDGYYPSKVAILLNNTIFEGKPRIELPFLFHDSGNNPGLTFEIQGVNGSNYPNGTILYQLNISSSEIPTDYYHMGMVIDLDYTIERNKNYSIVIYCKDNGCTQEEEYYIGLTEIGTENFTWYNDGSWKPLGETCGYEHCNIAFRTRLKGHNTFTTLTSLTDDFHNVVIFCNDTAGNIGLSDYIYFAIDIGPNITILHPVNSTTYSTSSVDLNWTANGTLDWCGYSLDGEIEETLIIEDFEDISEWGIEEDVGFITLDNLRKITGTYSAKITLNDNSAGAGAIYIQPSPALDLSSYEEISFSIWIDEDNWVTNNIFRFVIRSDGSSCRTDVITKSELNDDSWTRFYLNLTNSNDWGYSFLCDISAISYIAFEFMDTDSNTPPYDVWIDDLKVINRTTSITIRDSIFDFEVADWINQWTTDTLSSSIKKEGTYSLNITLTSIDNNDPGIYKDFSPTLDWSSFNYLSFWYWTNDTSQSNTAYITYEDEILEDTVEISFGSKLTQTGWNYVLLNLDTDSIPSGYRSSISRIYIDTWTSKTGKYINSYYIDDMVLLLNQSTNITLTSLSEGSHDVTIYCNNTAGNMGQSDMIYFNIGEFSDCIVLNNPGNYKLTQDIIDSSQSKCINITANDVTLDCQGHTIDGNDDADYGIYVRRSSVETTNITIKNCILSDWDNAGIYFYKTKGNTFDNVTVNSCRGGGFLIWNSFNNTLINVTANSNEEGLYSSGSDSFIISDSNFINNSLWDIYYLTNRNNLYCHSEFLNVMGTDNKPIVFYNDTVIIEDWNNNISEIILCGADNSVINNLTMDRIDIENNGLFLAATQNTTITNSEFIDLEYAIFLDFSDFNTLINVTANSNVHGIYLEFSDSNTLINITANSNTDDGISLNFAHSNNLTNIYANSNSIHGIDINGNDNEIINAILHSQSSESSAGLFLDEDNNRLYNLTIYSNYYGIKLQYTANNNIIANCLIYGNSYGIYMYSPAPTTPNLIYNNLFNQTDNVIFSLPYDENYWNTSKQSGTRIYSNGPNIGGNYWTNSNGNDYSDTCIDLDNDGFCDVAYDVVNDASGCISDNCDYFTLSDEYDGTAPIVDIIYPVNNVVYGSSSIDLNWSYSDDSYLDWCAYSLDGGANNTAIADEYEASFYGYNLNFENYSAYSTGNVPTTTKLVEIYNGSDWFNQDQFDSNGNYNITFSTDISDYLGDAISYHFPVYTHSGDLNIESISYNLSLYNYRTNAWDKIVIVSDYDTSSNCNVLHGNFTLISDYISNDKTNISVEWNSYDDSTGSKETDSGSITCDGIEHTPGDATDVYFEARMFITSLNFTNITLTGLSDGDHNITIYCNDSNGNIGLDVISFTIDTTAPWINITNPINLTKYDTDSIDLNWIYEDNSTLDWCAYSLDGGSNNTDIFPGSLCYQETASTSTVCGGLDTGSYYCDDNWDGTHTCEDVYDGDWYSYGWAGISANANLYVNYTKPVGATNSSLWVVSDSNNPLYGDNLTIDSNCWEQSPLQFRVLSDYISPFPTTWFCWNSTDWHILRYGDDWSSNVYEEAMWWNISTPSNITMTSLSQSSHNITIYCKDTLGNMGQSNYVYFTTGVMSINVTLGEGISKIQWRVPFYTGTTAYNVNATNQTNSIGLFRVINNGSLAGNLSMRFNDTYANVVTECAQNNAYTDSIVLSTNWQAVNDSLIVDDMVRIWCRRNYTAIPIKKSIKWQFNFTLIQ